MLIIIVGARGSGKTLFLTTMALRSNRPVYSNFSLDIGDRYHPINVIDLMNLPSKIELFLDEAYTWLEARTSGRALNKYLSYIAFQLRKRRMNIFLTVQQYRTIDVRYRDEWDMLVKCERKYNGKQDRNLWDFKYSFLDRKTLNTWAWRLPYEKSKKYYDYFDTYEIVEPHDKKRLELEILKDDPDQFWEKVKKVAGEIKPLLDQITHDTVKAGLIKAGYDLYYAKFVYLVLKEKIAF